MSASILLRPCVDLLNRPVYHRLSTSKRPPIHYEDHPFFYRLISGMNHEARSCSMLILMQQDRPPHGPSKLTYGPFSKFMADIRYRGLMCIKKFKNSYNNPTYLNISYISLIFCWTICRGLKTWILIWYVWLKIISVATVIARN